MALQFTANRRSAGNLSFSANQRGRMSVVPTVEWDNIQGAPAIGTDVQGYDDDLAALAANSSSGLLTRTGAGTVSARTITGTAAEITVADGSGVSGNPTLSLPAALTFTGKTITGGTFASPTITTGLTATNLVTNAALAQMAGRTFKGNNSGSTANAADLTVAQTQAVLGYSFIIGGYAIGVDANTLGDTAITITTPISNYRISSFIIQNTGTTASLTAAQFGVFTATGGGGTALSAAGQVLSGLTSNTINTAGQSVNLTPATTPSIVLNSSTLYFRITQAQGAAATINVYFIITLLPPS